MQRLILAGMLYDNSRPRYLPHMDNPEVLLMGLSPMSSALWIETDQDIGLYYHHKLAQRAQRGDAVYQARDDSLPAQQELAKLLLDHLLGDQSGVYTLENGLLHCLPGNFNTPIGGDEPLWNSSLWIADDLVIMEKHRDEYVLTAASLCSPSHWQLKEKFDRPMREIHDPIPGFHQSLTPRIDRFFEHLRPSHPVVRFNWSLQASNVLAQLPGEEEDISAAAALYYRTERQSLVRLPATGAIAFSIRVYLHPLEMLAEVQGALPTLFAAIDDTPAPLKRYKGFDYLAPALEKYRHR